MDNRFIDKNIGYKKYEPEINIKELKYNERLWKLLFPYSENVNLRKLKLSNIGSYVMTSKTMAMKTVELIQKYVKKDKIIITESNGGIGGNTIMFAKHFHKVNVVEILPLHADIIKNNLKVYGLNSKIEVFNEDYLDIMLKLKQDVIFMDVPWGGPDYKNLKNVKLGLNNVNIVYILNTLLKKDKAKLYILYVPFNYNFQDFMENINTKSILIYKIMARKQFQFIILVKATKYPKKVII